MVPPLHSLGSTTTMGQWDGREVPMGFARWSELHLAKIKIGSRGSAVRSSAKKVGTIAKVPAVGCRRKCTLTACLDIKNVDQLAFSLLCFAVVTWVDA